MIILILIIEHAAQRAVPLALRITEARAALIARQAAAQAALDECYV